MTAGEVVESNDEFVWKARPKYTPRPGAKALLNELLWQGIDKIIGTDGRWDEDTLLAATREISSKRFNFEQWQVLAQEAIDQAMRDFTHRNQPKVSNGVVRYDIETSLLVLGSKQRVRLKNATADDLQIWLDIRRVDAERKQTALGYERRWVTRVQKWMSDHPDARSFADYHQEVVTPTIGLTGK